MRRSPRVRGVRHLQQDDQQGPDPAARPTAATPPRRPPGPTSGRAGRRRARCATRGWMTAMRPTLQPGIFAVGTRSHHHLHFDVAPDAPAPEVLGALQRIREHATTIAGVNIVVGLGSELCARIAPRWLPEGVGPFETLEGPDGTCIPADQHDLWVWLHSAQPDAVFDVALATDECLQGVATVAVERPCFTYQASRDLTGFGRHREPPVTGHRAGRRPEAGLRRQQRRAVQHWVRPRPSRRSTTRRRTSDRPQPVDRRGDPRDRAFRAPSAGSRSTTTYRDPDLPAVGRLRRRARARARVRGLQPDVDRLASRWNAWSASATGCASPHRHPSCHASA